MSSESHNNINVSVLSLRIVTRKRNIVKRHLKTSYHLLVVKTFLILGLVTEYIIAPAGVNDVNLVTGTLMFFAFQPSIQNISFILNDDGIAQEENETFSIIFSGVILPPTAEIIRDRFDGIIIDYNGEIFDITP